MSTLNLPVCINCREQFDTEYRVPYTQPCNHTICKQCILDHTAIECPSDKSSISKKDCCINQALLYYLFGRSLSDQQPLDGPQEFRVNQNLIALAKLLRDSFIDETRKLSSQMSRRLLHLIESHPSNVKSRREFLMRLRSVYSRLLLELIQAHYNTKNREHDFRRFIQMKGCSVIPGLTDKVIAAVVKLYNAAQHPGKASYQRNVLIKYIMSELCSNDTRLKRQVEKTLQTLYRCSCFRPIQTEGGPSLLKLREDLYSIENLRERHDVEIIRLVQSANIRLTAQSWAHLLHGCSHPDVISKMQSLLDKHQSPVHLNELILAVKETGDRYKIDAHLNDLRDIQDSLEDFLTHESREPEYKSVDSVLERLTSVKHLFSIRQSRGTIHKIM